MYNKKYEERLATWSEFRSSLEDSNTPFLDVVDFYASAPKTRYAVDPWGQSTWPDPWQLLEENLYCEFSVVLGMCFSLQLTDKFSGSNFEIHISTNNKKAETHYLLFVDDICVNYKDGVISKENLPDALYSQSIYSMPVLQ
tara:strand:+ start:1211 stop:1633 length:423 start_codon:yes stop_codon:yes gene_type:complete